MSEIPEGEGEDHENQDAEDVKESGKILENLEG
jgi:hypothetical protein